VSFIARGGEHARGALDCVVRGEGELIAPQLLEAIGDARLSTLPGSSLRRAGPAPLMHDDLDRFPPARDLARRRRSIHRRAGSVRLGRAFRGCPGTAPFAAPDVSTAAVTGRRLRRQPQRTSRALRSPTSSWSMTSPSCIRAWTRVGASWSACAFASSITWRPVATFLFAIARSSSTGAPGAPLHVLGLEALDEESLSSSQAITPNENLRALEIAREIGFTVAVNIIAIRAGTSAVRGRARLALTVPRSCTSRSPRPIRARRLAHGVAALTTLDYRLFDVQHAVLPLAAARALLRGAGQEPVLLNRKHLVSPRSAVPRAWPSAGASRPDQFPSDAVEVRKRLFPRPAVHDT